MEAHQKQPFWHTTFAFVTAVGTLIGAIGGLVATIYATDGNDDASTLTPSPSAVSSAAPAASATATVKVTPRPSATPVVFELTAEADTWWGPPGNSRDGEEDEAPGETAYLILDWGCSEDSRGNGSKRDCGSGLIALYFDLGDLPENATIDEAVLTLHEEGGGGARTYARRASSGWSEGESAEPECDSSDEVAGEANEDEWRWDVTTLVQDQLADEGENFGFCLILMEDARVTFASREGPDARAPALTITYR
jgi:hypothetical protein